MGDTFGNQTHRRRTDTGRAHSARAAQDRATFDQDPDGDGCAAPLLVLTTVITAILGALLS